MTGMRGNAPVSVGPGPGACPLADALLSEDGHRPQGAECGPRLRRPGWAMDKTDLDWQAAGASLDERGWAVLPRLLDAPACGRAAALWGDESRFRNRVAMARHGFGQGEYRYFGYALPEPVERLRTGRYPPLAGIANRWQPALGRPGLYPLAHEDYLGRCRSAGQARPTPLLLRYGPGDYNCLHQDLYGAEAFPLQVAILLSRPGKDFTGGEFILAEQRRQSRATVVPLEQGDAVVFAVSERPVQGGRGCYRTRMKHGVSTVRSGERFTLGIIFHDAA